MLADELETVRARAQVGAGQALDKNVWLQGRSGQIACVSFRQRMIISRSIGSAR